MPGDPEETISIPIVGDTTPEIDETFRVTLTGPTNAELPADGATEVASVIGTIESDDAPILNIVNTNTNNGVIEGGDATFEVTLYGEVTGAVSATWVTDDGTAMANTTTPSEGDYVAETAGTLNFTDADRTESIIGNNQ